MAEGMREKVRNKYAELAPEDLSETREEEGVRA
jgi:hypothetical protein